MCMRSQSVSGSCSLPACLLSALPTQAFPAGKPHDFQRDGRFFGACWCRHSMVHFVLGERGRCCFFRWLVQMIPVWAGCCSLPACPLSALPIQAAPAGDA